MLVNQMRIHSPRMSKVLVQNPAESLTKLLFNLSHFQRLYFQRVRLPIEYQLENKWETETKKEIFIDVVPDANEHGSLSKYRKVKVKSLSRVRLFATPWTVAYQAPLSMGFSRQQYWSGVPFPSAMDLPDPGIEPGSPALYTGALPSEPPNI